MKKPEDDLRNSFCKSALPRQCTKYLKRGFSSLRNKRFRGVGEQRDSEERDFWTFCPREKWCEKQHPLFRFLAPIFRAGETPKIPFF